MGFVAAKPRVTICMGHQKFASSAEHSSRGLLSLRLRSYVPVQVGHLLKTAGKIFVLINEKFTLKIKVNNIPYSNYKPLDLVIIFKLSFYPLKRFL